MATAEKRTRTTPTLADQKAKLAASKAKVAALAAKVAVLELKDYVQTLKVDSVQGLFAAVKAHSKDAKDLAILQTIAEIVGLKVTITQNPKATRASKGTAKKPKAASK